MVIPIRAQKPDRDTPLWLWSRPIHPQKETHPGEYIVVDALKRRSEMSFINNSQPDREPNTEYLQCIVGSTYVFVGLFNTELRARLSFLL